MALFVIAIIVLLVGVILFTQGKGKEEKGKGALKLAGIVCVLVAVFFHSYVHDQNCSDRSYRCGCYFR